MKAYWQRYGVTVKLMKPLIPVVGSVAITWNVTLVAPVADVVVRDPVVESILTFVIELGFVVQVTESVTSNVPPDAVAVALNCSLEPYLMLLSPSAEATVILVMPLSVTVMVAEPLKVPEEPVILDVPGETPVTKPLVLPTVATVGVPLFQNTFEVIVLVLPSL
jgi:hypothetical protein